MSYYPYAVPPAPPWPPLSAPAPFPLGPAPTPGISTGPVYTIIVTGLFLFMASNVMPNLLPGPDRIFHIAPQILMWGFMLIILALLAQMTGLSPGVPYLHLTYVHMTVAALLFVLIWNHIISELPPPPAAPASSSTSSSPRSAEKERPKEERKKESAPAPEAPSPWDEPRAHPSAFLTTRLNPAALWPFPLGRASRSVGSELWWESGTPLHVGHFNRPAPEVEEEKKDKKEDKGKDKKDEAKDKDEDKGKEKEKEKETEEERAKRKEKEKAIMKAEQAKAEMKAQEEASAKDKARAKAKDQERATAAGVSLPTTKASSVPGGSKEQKERQKLWRIKCMVMIVGVSLLHKGLALVLLLFFSLHIVGVELNATDAPDTSLSASVSASSAPVRPSSGTGGDDKAKLAAAKQAKEEERTARKAAEAAAAEKAKGKTSSSSSGDTASSGSSKVVDAHKEAEKAKEMERAKLKEKEREKEKAKLVAAKEAEKAKVSSSASKSGSSSSSRSSKPSSSSSGSSPSSSSSKPIGSEAIREAAGSKTVTKPADGEGPRTRLPPGIGMHYIHVRDEEGALDLQSSAIPSRGMGHPLMTTMNQGWAN